MFRKKYTMGEFLNAAAAAKWFRYGNGAFTTDAVVKEIVRHSGVNGSVEHELPPLILNGDIRMEILKIPGQGNIEAVIVNDRKKFTEFTRQNFDDLEQIRGTGLPSSTQPGQSA